MLAQQVLEASAERRPEAVALVSGAERWTYAALDTAANRVAHALRDGGVRRGDRVVIVLDNSAAAVIAIFGVLKAGATFVVLHASTKPEKLAAILADATPAALVADRPRLRDAAAVLAATPSLRCVLWADNAPLPLGPAIAAIPWDGLAGYPGARPGGPAIDLDLAMLIYTSGTTGQPKGVMATHQNMLAATTSVNAYLHNSAADVILNVLPLAFGYGLYQAFLAFQVGGRVVLDKTFAFPARTVALLEEEGVTGLPGVPTLFALLLRYPDLLRRDLPALRYMTNAGAALPVNHLQQIRAAFPRVDFFCMYGQTECKRISYLPPAEVDRRPGSVGIAIPNSEVYIVDDAGQRLPPGAVGELVVRGAHVTRGYWRAPALTAERFRPGPVPGETVLYTGDLFRMDAEGFLYFVARKDDIIKSRGEKVSPLEVENAICELAGVAEAAVVGVPDPVLGQAVVALVVPRAGADLSPREVRAHCARILDDFMVPQTVRVVGELPRTDNGKVNKARIQAELVIGPTTS